MLMQCVMLARKTIRADTFHQAEILPIQQDPQLPSPKENIPDKDNPAHLQYPRCFPHLMSPTDTVAVTAYIATYPVGMYEPPCVITSCPRPYLKQKIPSQSAKESGRGRDTSCKHSPRPPRNPNDVKQTILLINSLRSQRKTQASHRGLYNWQRQK
ncbi:hypothetical protein CEXT_66861 [Caerostris extrusa]|uniref:Uncharacterized protein n=1 Tax=Caerostris extrusa TaxID=172846 RepID=A0AAV4T2M8_CAEEX|nr:hypothetical protein CEXT_66861 [Caerostris extrusa]